MGHYAVADASPWRQSNQNVRSVIRYYAPGRAYNDADVVHPLTLPEPAVQPDDSIAEYGLWPTWLDAVPNPPLIAQAASPATAQYVPVPLPPPLTLEEVMALAVQRASAKRKLATEALQSASTESAAAAVNATPQAADSSALEDATPTVTNTTPTATVTITDADATPTGTATAGRGKRTK